MLYQRGHRLGFLQGKVGDDQDWGPYVEYDDQLHSGYRLVRQCRVSRNRLELDLARSVLSLPEVTGFDIGLQLTQAAFENLVLNLRRIVQGEEQLLLCEAE